MSIGLPVAIFIILTIVMGVLRKNGVIKNHNVRRYEVAEKNGWVAIARIKKREFSSSFNSDRQTLDEWRCKYSFEADGKEYSFREEFRGNPPEKITIYYDKQNRYKRIDPQRRTLSDTLLMYVPLLTAILVFFIMNII